MKSQINEILTEFREFATSHNYQDTPMLTAYVDIDPTKPDNQRERPAWLIELNQEARRIDQDHAEALKRRPAQARRAQVEEMLLEHLQERKPTGRAVALFSDLDDYVAVDLPVSMPTRLYYGFPQIKHLLFALDQYKDYLVMLFSGAETRVSEVFLTRTTEDVVIGTEHEKLRRLSRKSMEAGQDRRGPEFERRFVREVAAELNRYFLENPEVERLVLGGNLKVANAVKNALHPAVQRLIVAIEPLDFKAPENEIAAAVKQLSTAYEQAHDEAVVEELIRLHAVGGAAALGRDAVESALGRGQVRTLVLPYPMDAAEFDALIVDAVVNGADVEFVYGPVAERLEEAGGIGARLYYTL